MSVLLTSLALTLGPALPQGGDFAGTGIARQRKVEIHWNRVYTDVEIFHHFDRLQAAWPEFMTMEVIGHSYQGREMRVYTINNPKTGDHRQKPAMWVDANVHGNEVQGSEATLYLASYLLENYGTNRRITELLDRSAFYLMPMVNPDGRANWFEGPHTASSSRTGYKPTDNDRDGSFDEDGPNDLNGDGHITMMRKHVPGEGTHRVNPDDPRVMERVPVNDKGIRGDWILLGREGLDDDGDGRVNEDGDGGYDMNRAWPALWRPEHVQYGAGPYPLCWPEARCIADFLYDHPNVAAVQSFHNAGGMVLRGPGGQEFGEYERRDLRAFDSLGEDGELMLPFYRYMVIWKDLYSVYGGFATWAYEGLGIISFTNELWSRKRSFPDANSPQPEDRHFFDDNLLSGAGFIPWSPVNHPLYGEIEVGGFRKDVGRMPPSFLIEEESHRNALFCIKHAEAMPEVVIEKIEVAPVAGGLHTVDVIFRNKRRIPTRTARAAKMGIGVPDRFDLEGAGLEVLAGGFRSDEWRPERIDLAERNPGSLVSEDGIDGLGLQRVRWFVRGTGQGTLRWTGEKGVNVEGMVRVP